MSEIKLEDIKSFSKQYNSNPMNKVIQNAITNNGLEKACLNRDILKENQPIFNIELPEGKRLDQESSCKCWIYAGINMIKKNIADNLNLALNEINLSDNYIAFFDKLEKSNNFYETVIHEKDVSMQNLNQLNLFKFPVSEGGYWEWFVTIVCKYGIVPLSCMPNTEPSMKSMAMQELYTEKVKKDVLELIRLKEKSTPIEELENSRNKYLQENYEMLAKMLGEPPANICYEYKDKQEKYQKITNITPIQFKDKYLTISLEDFVSIGNVPMYNKSYEKYYRKKYLGNVYGKSSVEFLNLPIEELKELVIKQLKEGIPVWLAGHIMKARDVKSGVLDTRLYNYEQTMNLKRLSKEEALNTRDISSHHAMIFSGVNLKDNKPERWKIEDSYGDKNKVNGCYIMNDNFFEDFVMLIVVHKKYLSERQLKLLEQEPIDFQIDDPI
ncbi:MAG: hypothetical protein HFJ33_00165 [Clostridia bacterium]|nr:hypothetical protein [Clostridia bacterium]